MALAEDHDVREELAPTAADPALGGSVLPRTAKPGQEIPLREAGIPCGDEAFPCPLDPFTSQPLDVARVPDEAANAQDVAIDTFPDSDRRCCTALAESEMRLVWWPRYVRP